MSRTYHDKMHRRKVHNAYLQKILNTYAGDFGQKHQRSLSKLARIRQKEIDRKEIAEYE